MKVKVKRKGRAETLREAVHSNRDGADAGGLRGPLENAHGFALWRGCRVEGMEGGKGEVYLLPTHEDFAMQVGAHLAHLTSFEWDCNGREARPTVELSDCRCSYFHVRI